MAHDRFLVGRWKALKLACETLKRKSYNIRNSLRTWDVFFCWFRFFWATREPLPKWWFFGGCRRDFCVDVWRCLRSSMEMVLGYLISHQDLTNSLPLLGLTRKFCCWWRRPKHGNAARRYVMTYHWSLWNHFDIHLNWTWELYHQKHTKHFKLRQFPCFWPKKTSYFDLFCWAFTYLKPRNPHSGPWRLGEKSQAEIWKSQVYTNSWQRYWCSRQRLLHWFIVYII